jgi:hypothetical protein
MKINELKNQNKQYEKNISQLNEKIKINQDEFNEKIKINQDELNEKIKINQDENEKHISQLNEKIKINQDENEKHISQLNNIHEKKIFQLNKTIKKYQIDKNIYSKKIKDVDNNINILKSFNYNLINQFKNTEIFIDKMKFSNEKFHVIGLYNDDTSLILLKNEISNIFSEIHYIPYYEDFNEYINIMITIFKCLENFQKMDDKKYLIIFDRKFEFLYNNSFIIDKLNYIQDKNFDFLLLNYNNYDSIFHKFDDIFIDIRNPNNFNSFIINKSFCSEYMNYLEENINNVIQSEISENLYQYNINNILKMDNSFAIIPSLGKMRNIYNKKNNIIFNYNFIISLFNIDDLNISLPFHFNIIKESVYNYQLNNILYLKKKDNIINSTIEYYKKIYPKIEFLFCIYDKKFKYQIKKIQEIFQQVIINTKYNIFINKNNNNMIINLKNFTDEDWLNNNKKKYLNF